MAQGRPLTASMLTNYATASRAVTTEDDYGDLNVTSIDTIATFWCDIKELKSDSILETGKKRITRVIEITARENDVLNIDLDDEITFGNSSDTYQVNDYYESDWRWGRTIIAEYKE